MTAPAITRTYAQQLRELGWLDCDTCGVLFDPELCDGHIGDGFDPVHGDHPAWCSPCNTAQAFVVFERCTDHHLHTFTIVDDPTHATTIHTDRARGVCQAACTCGDRSRVYDVAFKDAARRHASVHRIAATRLAEVRAERTVVA